MKIKSKLIFLILGTFIVLIPLFSILYYTKVKEIILTQTYEHLEAVSQTKKIRLQDIIQKRFDLLTLFSTNPDLDKSLSHKQNLNEYSMDSTLDNLLKRYIRIINSFHEINILNKEGVVLASSLKSNLGEDYSRHPFFIEALEGKKNWGDFHYDREGKLSTYLCGPVSRNGKIYGVVLIESTANDVLSLTSDYTGLGETGETIIGMRRKDTTVLVNSLRFNKGKPLQEKLDTGNLSFPMNQALGKKEGIVLEGRDYRNISVIASIRYIPEIGWGMVTKIDTKEAFSSINHLMYLLWLINVLAILVICVISKIGISYIVKPIEHLRQVVDYMKDGNFAVRAKISSNDEIGALAKSYNEMADSLQKKIIDLDNFIYTASHDLKAPISNIEGLIAALPEVSRASESKEEYGSILSMLTQSVEKLKRTIRELTEISRIQQNLAEDIKKVDICETINEVTSLLREDIKRSNASVVVDTSHCPTIYYSKKDLRSVIYNLISNSIKYKADNRNPVIHITAQTIPGYVQLIIEDNGLGIPKQNLNHIFLMFRRFHDHVEGTGIGLYIVKRIIENNGGKIEVDSEVNKGTTFKIYFRK